MVDIFKTNIQNHFDAIKLKEILLKEFPDARITIDIQHSNKLLRTEGKQIPAARVIQLVKLNGFYCELLEQTL